MNVKNLLAKQIINLDAQVTKTGSIEDKIHLHNQLHGYLKTYYDNFGTEEFPEQKETAANATVSYHFGDSENGNVLGNEPKVTCP